MSEHVIHATWLITCANEDAPLRQHALVMQGPEIVDILPSAQATLHYPNANHEHLSDHALIPGLINTHGHLAMTLFRGLADDLPLMTWLGEHIWPAEGKWVSREFVHDGSRLAMAEMIKGGTTCFSDMYFFPDAVAEVATEIGMRAQLCAPILDFPTIWAGTANEYIDKALQLHARYKKSGLIRIGLGPHAPYTVSDTPMQRIAELARIHQMPVQIHLHETQHEVDTALASTGQRPIARLQDLGLLDAGLTLQCVHMTAINDIDIALVRSAGASVLHCPESNLKLASGFCPVARLIKEGINVALGTDGAASNNDLNLLGEMRTAALLAKAVANDASALNALTALKMATINGARALGIDHLTGSLEIGKRADVVAIDLRALNTTPTFNPISNIVYAASARQVRHVWIDGKKMLENRRLTIMDEDALRQNAADWAQRIDETDQ
jgi:5-methylthioadenosine/S-adenosylhomocysteine deaminase